MNLKRNLKDGEQALKLGLGLAGAQPSRLRAPRLKSELWGRDVLKYFNIFSHRHKDAVRGRIRVGSASPPEIRRIKRAAGKPARQTAGRHKQLSIEEPHHGQNVS